MAATRTRKDSFPKNIYEKAQVEAVQARRLKNGRATSCDLSEDDQAYYLTSVWPVV